MNRFAWTAHKRSPKRPAASTTVADAMTRAARKWPRVRPTSIVKAGGIDLLDLLKEACWRRHAREPAADPGLDASPRNPAAACASAPMVTLAQAAADHRLVRQRYPALADALPARRARRSATWRRWAAICCSGRAAGTFARTSIAACAKGGGHCFAIPGENQYHAIFDNTPARSSIPRPRPPCWWRWALRSNSPTRKAPCAASCSRISSCRRTAICSARTTCKPHEILTAIVLPPLPPAVRMAHLKQGEKDSFDWPLADVAVVLDLSPPEIAAGGDRPGRGGTGAAPRQSRRGHADGKRVDDAAARDAGRAALEGASPLAHNAYKLPLFETLVRRAILDAATHT
jgi:xanthine dehydrogenase YagS FAD-binding subunit